MTRKTKDLYIVTFNEVKELLPNFLPVHDFIRWLNSSNSDITSDCVRRYSLVLVTNFYINRFCRCFKKFALRYNFTIRHKKIADFVQLF